MHTPEFISQHQQKRKQFSFIFGVETIECENAMQFVAFSPKKPSFNYKTFPFLFEKRVHCQTTLCLCHRFPETVLGLGGTRGFPPGTVPDLRGPCQKPNHHSNKGQYNVQNSKFFKIICFHLIIWGNGAPPL